MTQSQFGNASNRLRKEERSGGRDSEGGEPERDVEDVEWRTDKLDRSETVVYNKLPTVFLLGSQS